MLIDIRADGFSLTRAILDHATARVEAGLRPFSSLVQRVRVTVTDINATRGGIDKRCDVIVTLRHKDPLVVHATHENLYLAITQAALRLRHVLQRSAKRHLTRQRRPQPRLPRPTAPD